MPRSDLLSAAGPAGVHVDEQSVLTYSVVLTAINRISTDYARFSIKVYERLPAGGNPLEQPQPSESKLKIDAEGNDEDARNAVREVVLDGVQRLLRRESEAIKRAAPKPGFRDWIDEFYEEHEANIIEKLTPSIRAFNAVIRNNTNVNQIAKDRCSESRTTLLGFEEVTTADQRAEAVEEIVTKWEKEKLDHIWGMSA